MNINIILEVGVKMDINIKKEFEKSKFGDKEERYEAYQNI